VENFPKLALKGFADIRKIRGDELIETISSAYRDDGIDETMIITRSNKRALIYNNGIRNSILFCEEELSSGDRLLVSKNNYFWKTGTEEANFIANGDIMEIARIRKTTEFYGFRFADLTVRFPDYDTEADLKIITATLQMETPSLPQELNNKLFFTILEDYEDIPAKAEKMKKMKVDPHYNAVQVKFAYAMTCHKAQGGQWKNVFLDIGFTTEDMLGEDFYRWLYTAFTRATHRLFLVNLPEEFESGFVSPKSSK
jgi:exodeoxyribonuclease-5